MTFHIHTDEINTSASRKAMICDAGILKALIIFDLTE